MATPDPASMTPAAALSRHLEWLEYALAAARDEEDRRRARLERATNKNRDKRTTRLAEVSAEVVELAALVEGIKSLQAAAVRPKSSSASSRGGARKTTGTRRTSRAGSGRGSAAAKPASARSAAVDTNVSTNGTEPTAPKKPAAKKPAASKPAAKKPAATKPATRSRRSTTRRSGTSS
jgi:hypothetical protein